LKDPSRSRRVRSVLRPTAPARLALVSALLILGACRSPQARIDELARRGSLEREVVTGASFQHVIYRPREPRAGDELHVYLEGDGTPYIARALIAADPTPRAPLALELMLEDPGPVLYLGRPCYIGLAHDPPCEPAYWTLKRFSPEVVQSLAAALTRELESMPRLHVTLIGHSGGAALALLVADRVPAVDRVITIAGNLDVDGWTRLHDYTPLRGSLDPMTSGLHRTDLTLVHLAGGADRNVPETLVRAAASRLGGTVVVIPGFDHGCCWTKIWPEILRQSFSSF
jgi:pimeloyl-ACP methyl ester carboxylesterase